VLDLLGSDATLTLGIDGNTQAAIIAAMKALMSDEVGRKLNACKQSNILFFWADM
jgi:hypothetical protein